ncbi:MAG: hypothetical protein ABL879_15660 [Devosia sp.]
MPRSADLTLPHRPLRLIGGAAIAAGIAALITILLLAILGAATAQPGAAVTRLDIGWLLWITTLQATLSTFFSLAAGVALAWSLNRLRFAGRGLVVGLFASAIVTPGIIVAFGLLAVWGRSGWLSSLAIAATGAPLDLPIFGLGGVVAAHVILDGAFAARILLARLDALPEQRLKMGQSLALSAAQRFAILDWPMLRGSLPGLGAVIFLLAFTSFPIVLLLGGGPAVQTLEVAIYSAVRLDFDLIAAVTLALIQIAVCAAIILLTAVARPVSISLAQPIEPRWRDDKPARVMQWVILTVALLGFGLPLLAVLIGGLNGATQVLAQSQFWRALTSSLSIAIASALLTLVLATTLAAGRATISSRALRIGLGIPAYAYLAMPAVALSLGAFILVRNLGIGPEPAAPIVVILANALLALPFAMATLAPGFDAIAASHGKLLRSLGLGGLVQFTQVEWPILARDFGVVFALAFCFSLGDLGVIALFGTQDFVTLPLLMLRALGAYRSNDAAAIAALMLVLTILAFSLLPPLFERLGNARAR